MSWFIGEQVFISSTQLVTNEETSGVKESFWKTFGIDYDKFKSTYKIEGISVPSSEGDHDIPGDYIYAKGADTKDRDTVILIHGLGGNRYSNYPVAAYFWKRDITSSPTTRGVLARTRPNTLPSVIWKVTTPKIWYTTPLI